MTRIVFGRDVICPQCQHLDRRGKPYGLGYVVMSQGRAKGLHRKIVGYPYGRGKDDRLAVHAECPVCEGRGYVSA